MTLFMKKIWQAAAAFALISGTITLTGCSSSPTVSYANPNSVDTTTIDFGSTDLQSITTKMVDQMLSSPALAQLNRAHESSGVFDKKMVQPKPPVLFISSIDNRTDEHIDTKNITDAISTQLINSGKFRFIDMSQVNQVKKQLHYQQASDMVNPDTAVKVGRQIGAHFMLYGAISSIRQRNSSLESLYYQVTLKLLNIQSNIIVWQGQKDIRKTAKRKTFGW